MGDFVPRGTSSKTALQNHIKELRQFEDILKKEADLRGLLGPKDLEIAWERHILNSLPIVELIPEGVRVADLGSGAGLPGIPLAIARKDLKVTLIEPMARRVEFLNEVISKMELKNVQVVKGKAENLAKNLQFDFVTARAVAPLKKLVKLAVPLLKPKGYLLAIKGQKAEIELNEALDEILKLKATSLGVVKAGTEIGSEVSMIVVRAE